MTALRVLLDNYLTMRRALGYKLKTEGAGLKTFVAFMEARQADHITIDLALEWALQPRSVQVVQQARRLGFVRSFARHCSAIDARTQVPLPDLIPCQRLRPQPCFFTDADIANLLRAALALPGKDGLRPWTFHCLFGLLCVSGLRIGEAQGLIVEDIDLDEAILTIRASKFGKSRLVPLHATTVDVLDDYLQRRQRFLHVTNPVKQVFVNDGGTRLSNDQALRTFQRLLTSIGFIPERERRRPHLHDLRHRFAIETLLHWYRDGDDVERRLPVLSAYLGHTEVRDTYWYLSARPELMTFAQERLERHWEKPS